MRIEGGNATDGADMADETGQGETKRESSPTPLATAARSDDESNLPFGLGKGYVELLKVARPEELSPAEATKVARPEQLSPTEAAKVARPELSQDYMDLDDGVTEQASPATVVMSPGSQAQVERWKLQSLLPRIVPPGHEPEIAQRQIVPPTTAAMPLLGEPITPIVKAAMPSAPEETMMLCPQGITPVRYESGKGQAATPLLSLGNVKEVFTDIVMEEALDDEGEDLQQMLEDEKPIRRQSPSPLRDLYEEETSYSSEDSAEVLPTGEAFGAGFFEPQEQFDDEAQAQYEAQANVQNSRTENADERVQTHEMARASDRNILTDNGNDKAQAQADQAMVPALLAEREQPILTQQKVMDLIMQQQALPNNTLGSLRATSWATKKQDFSDMLSGFRSPTGTTYRVALDLASVLFVSVAAADANRISLMAQDAEQQKLVAQAEKHREALEKEFTLNLERIREENQKTMDQTIRIREELMKSCQPINNAGMLEKIEENQGAEFVKFQLKMMQAQRDRLELELRNSKERHEA